MVDIPGTIAAIRSGIGILKDLMQIDHEFDKADLKLKIAKLNGTLANAEIALTKAQTELHNKDKELERLKKNLSKEKELVEIKGFKYDANEDGKPQGLPYCPRCWEKDGSLMRIAELMRGKGQCPECKALFGKITEYR